ncbi:MAG TPA: hypothetical protein VFC67_11705 [Prolixibacteraceae bacterium]|nr:hypothetical protein [Prolixibacteraceae bacterium]
MIVLKCYCRLKLLAFGNWQFATGDWQLAAGFLLHYANIYLNANFLPSTICKLSFASYQLPIASCYSISA